MTTRSQILAAAAEANAPDGIACVTVSPSDVWHIVDNGVVVGVAGRSAFSAAHELRKYVARVNTCVIPDDGEEHSCECGHGCFHVWDFDGYLRGKRAVVNDEGQTESFCPNCDRELLPGEVR